MVLWSGPEHTKEFISESAVGEHVDYEIQHKVEFIHYHTEPASKTEVDDELSKPDAVSRVHERIGVGQTFQEDVDEDEDTGRSYKAHKCQRDGHN